MDTRKSLIKSRMTIIALGILCLALISGGAWAVIGAFTPETKNNPGQPTASDSAFDPLSYAIDVSDVDRTSRTAVAKRFAEIAMTWYPAKDHSLTDAELRATGLMSLERAQSMFLPERPATGEEWNLWGKRNGYTIPNVQVREPLHGADSDSPDNEFVNVEVSVVYRWKAVDFDSEYVDEERVFYLAMHEDSKIGWEVSDYLYEVIPLKAPVKSPEKSPAQES